MTIEDTEISKIIEELKSKEKIKFKSIHEFSLETKIGRYKILKYKEFFEDEGIFIDIRKYEEKLLEKIKKLKDEGKTEFNSIKQLSKELGLGNQVVKKYLNLFKEENIYIDKTVKEKLLDSIKKLKGEGKTEFKSMKQLSREINVQHGLIKSHLKLFSDEGISVDIRTPEEKLLDSIKKLKEKNKTKFYSINSLAKEIGRNSGVVNKNLVFFKENGIEIILKTSHEKLLNLIKKAQEENKTKFKSIKDCSREFKVDDSTIKKHILLLESKGIFIDLRTNKEKMLDSIKEFKTNRKKYFSSINELSLEIGMSYGTIKRYLELFEQEGIQVDLRTRKEKILMIIEELKKENKTQFSSLNSFEKKTGIIANTVKNHLEFIHKNGVFIDISTDEEKLQKIIYKLIEENKRHFPSIISLAREANLSQKTIRDNLSLFRNAGIKINSLNNQKINITNYIKISQDFNNLQIVFENHLAFQELSEEFFRKKIHISNVSMNAIALSSSIFKIFSKIEIKNIIEQAIVNLIMIDTLDFSLMEFKYQLYLNKIYFTTDTILDNLSLLNQSLAEDTIERRLRLAKRILLEEDSPILYVQELPEINNDLDKNIFILESIKNKKNKLWDQYLNFLLSCNLYQEELKKLDYKFINSLSFDELFIFFKYLHIKGSDKDNVFFNIENLILGFFLWLVSKSKVIFHSEYIEFHDKIIENICEKIFKNHVVLRQHQEIIKNSEINEKKITTLKKTNAIFHQYLLASSTKVNCALKDIIREDIDIYAENVEEKIVNGTISQSVYMRSFLKYVGNPNALNIPKKETIREYYLRLISEIKSINKETISNYRDLIEYIIKIIEFEIDNEGKSISYSRERIKSLIFLLSYLSEFPKKLNAIEFAKMLNTINLDEKGMYNWAIKQNEKIKFKRYTPCYLLFFDNLPNESEYKRIFDRKWLLVNRKRNSERSFIRNGFEYPIYVTFQELALHNPPKTPGYPIKRTAPTGEQVDMSWWKHDETSPILAICNWLISKLPRRSTHILNLDVNTFLQYNSDGSLKGFYINTDKNQNLNANNKFIPSYLVNILFTNEEIKLLENYVKYIKEVYSHYIPVEYKNGGSYDAIQPLFPHLENNDIFPRQMLTAFYTKTLLKTQIKVNKLAKEGFFDNFYSEELRNVKIDYLSKCNLIKIKKKDLVNDNFSIEKIDDVEEIGFSLNKWYEVFSSIDGLHNMRHAGSSALLSREGLSLMQIKIITGHTSLDTLANIYIKINEENTKLYIEKVGKTIVNYLDSPIKGSGLYIEKKLIPITISNNPKDIFKELKNCGFMSLSRYVMEKPTEIYGKKEEQIKYVTNDGLVVKGLEIASRFHPDTYECFNHGICTVQRRCPSGTNEVCCLCPHLIFNLLHIEGILYKHQHTMLEMKFIQDKLAEAQKRGNSSSRSELQKLHNSKVNELIGWSEMIDMISKKFEIIENKVDINEENNEKSITVKNDQKLNKFIFSRNVEEDEMIMELLLKANMLKIDTPETDNLVNRISSKIIVNAIKYWNKETLIKMEKDGLKWIIEAFGKKAIDERKNYLNSFLVGNKGEKKINKVETKMIT
ncbi:NUMOD1 domain-containing DNA-binding protein [Aliarcobacter butzleri]|uniref:NUMOD1 domain-containing DNA-binding protein n=1 Tax=Aliarcobacter butzleri TaxID=28197 RepID=UPI003AF791DF